MVQLLGKESVYLTILVFKYLIPGLFADKIAAPMAVAEVLTPVNPNIFCDFFESRRNAGRFAREIEPNIEWEDSQRRLYGKESGYDSNFIDIPGQRPLIEYIRDFKERKGWVYALDVMSFGYALSSIRRDLTGGISISLTNPRGREKLDQDRKYGLEFVAQHKTRAGVYDKGKNTRAWAEKLCFGDILQGSTWHEVRKHIKKFPVGRISDAQTATEVFGLVVCAGEGGWKTFEKDEALLPKNTLHLPQKEIYYLGVNRMWKYVSKEKGVLCVLLNPNYGWDLWVGQLKHAGINVEHDNRQALRFIKDEKTPVRFLRKLPRMRKDMQPRIFKGNPV